MNSPGSSNEQAIQRMARAICNAWVSSGGCCSDESGKSPCNARNCSIYTVAVHALQELGELPASAHEPELRRLVEQQANDDGLWFDAQTAAEGYLQQELRKLHAAIEGERIEFRKPVLPPAADRESRLLSLLARATPVLVASGLYTSTDVDIKTQLLADIEAEIGPALCAVCDHIEALHAHPTVVKASHAFVPKTSQPHGVRRWGPYKEGYPPEDEVEELRRKRDVIIRQGGPTTPGEIDG